MSLKAIAVLIKMLVLLPHRKPVLAVWGFLVAMKILLNVSPVFLKKPVYSLYFILKSFSGE